YLPSLHSFSHLLRFDAGGRNRRALGASIIMRLPFRPQTCRHFHSQKKKRRNQSRPPLFIWEVQPTTPSSTPRGTLLCHSSSAQRLHSLFRVDISRSSAEHRSGPKTPSCLGNPLPCPMASLECRAEPTPTAPRSVSFHLLARQWRAA